MAFKVFFGFISGATESVGAAAGTSTASADGGGAAYLRPSATDLAGGWTDQSGGTALSAAVDEAAQNDADYIQSSNSPANDICRVSMAAGGAYLDGSKTIRVGYTLAGAGVDVTVRLKQATTLITSWNHSGGALTGTPVLFVQTLTSGERAAVDWNSPNTLKIELEADV